MDISDVWQEQGWLESYPKGFVALSSVGDRQYFVPTSWYWWAIYYRPSIFEQYGITPPQTWDELLAACDTLNPRAHQGRIRGLHQHARQWS